MDCEKAMNHSWLALEIKEKKPLRRVGTNLKTTTIRRQNREAKPQELDVKDLKTAVSNLKESGQAQ